MDGCKEFFQKELDDSGVLSLGQDLEQIFIAQEIEAREFASLDLQKVIHGLLASLLLLVDVIQGLLEAFYASQSLQFWHLLKRIHYRLEGAI